MLITCLLQVTRERLQHALKAPPAAPDNTLLLVGLGGETSQGDIPIFPPLALLLVVLIGTLARSFVSPPRFGCGSVRETGLSEEGESRYCCTSSDQ